MPRLMPHLLILISSLCILAQERAIDRYTHFAQTAKQAMAQNDLDTAIAATQQILEMMPGHPSVMTQLAILEAMAGRKDQAMAHLKHAVILGQTLSEPLDPAVQQLVSQDEFAEIRRCIEAAKQPVSHSQVAYVIPERDLTPEGIAYDPVDDCFYLGSMWKHKIIRLDRDGSHRDFTQPNQDGLRSMAGLRVDPQRRTLWAISIVTRLVPSTDLAQDGWSGLFRYDLATGLLTEKFEFQAAGEKHLLNDLALTRSGDLYLTDSEFGAIYRFEAQNNRVELFIAHEDLFFPNGITLNPSESSLFVACSGMGIFRIDLDTKNLTRLKAPEDISLIGVDGMYFFDQSLVCVQNRLNRIVRFYLDATGDTVTHMDLIETHNPHFVLPTTGALVGDDFFYIANSQVYSTDAQRKLLPTDQLKDIVILRAKLDHSNAH